MAEIVHHPAHTLAVLIATLLWITYHSPTDATDRDTHLPSREAFMKALVPPDTLSPEDSCIICHDGPQDPLQLSCGHIYCRHCIVAWFRCKQNMCPCCRRALFFDPTIAAGILFKIATCAFATALYLNLLRLLLLCMWAPILTPFTTIGIATFILFILGMVWWLFHDSRRGPHEWWRATTQDCCIVACVLAAAAVTVAVMTTMRWEAVLRTASRQAT